MSIHCFWEHCLQNEHNSYSVLDIASQTCSCVGIWGSIQRQYVSSSKSRVLPSTNEGDLIPESTYHYLWSPLQFGVSFFCCDHFKNINIWASNTYVPIGQTLLQLFTYFMNHSHFTNGFFLLFWRSKLRNCILESLPIRRPVWKKCSNEPARNQLQKVPNSKTVNFG